MSGGGENYDFCEYVYNPLMRQYQAMMRLMSMLRDSQSDCNDVQCFTSESDASNPMSIMPNTSSSSSFFTNLVPVLFVWALFVFALFMFRPASMRADPNAASAADKAKSKSKNALGGRFFRDDHDDDNSTVS